MQIKTVLFGESESFARMARALQRSVEKNSPRTPFEIVRPEYPVQQILQLRNNHHRTTFIDNAHKTKYHKDIVDQAEDGQLICLVDSDILITGDFHPVTYLNHFDFAYTIRKSKKGPINSGVTFVRVSEKTRAFYHTWYENVLDLLARRSLFDGWAKKYGGINQCGLGMMLEENKHFLQLMELPCSVWNLCFDQWHLFGPSVKAVHYHGAMRKFALTSPKKNLPDTYSKLAKLWKQYDG